MAKHIHKRDLDAQGKWDEQVIERWVKLKEAQTIRSLIVPNASFDLKAVDHDTQPLVESLLKHSRCLPNSYQNIYEVNLDPESITHVKFEELGTGGQYRRTYLVHTHTGKGDDQKEMDQSIILKIQRKPSLTAVHMGKEIDYPKHQVSGGRHNPPTQDKQNVGGLWMLDDKRVILTLRNLEGTEYIRAVNERSLKESEKREIDKAMVRRMTDWWKKEDHCMIQDPHGLNLMLLKERDEQGRPRVELIDAGIVVKTNEKSLISKMTCDPNIDPDDIPADYSPPVARTWRNTIRAEDVVDGVVEVLGKREGIEFFNTVYREGPKHGSVVSPVFDNEFYQTFQKRFGINLKNA